MPRKVFLFAVALLALTGGHAEGEAGAEVGADGSPQPLYVKLNVDLGGGRKEPAIAKEGDDLDAIAEAFCKDHGVDPRYAAPTVSAGLRDLLDELKERQNAVDAPAATPSEDEPKVAPKVDAEPQVQLSVELPDGTKQYALCRESEDPDAAARAFCETHGLDMDLVRPRVAAKLRELLVQLKRDLGKPVDEVSPAPASEAKDVLPVYVRLNVELPNQQNQIVVAKKGDDLEQIATDFIDEHPELGGGAKESIIKELRKLLDKLEERERAAAAGEPTAPAKAEAAEPAPPVTPPPSSPVPSAPPAEPKAAMPPRAAEVGQSVQLNVDLPNGEKAAVVARWDEDPREVALAFCKERELNPAVLVEPLTNGLRSLLERLAAQRSGATNMRRAVFTLPPVEPGHLPLTDPVVLTVERSDGTAIGTIELKPGQDASEAVKAFFAAHTDSPEVVVESQRYGTARLAKSLLSMLSSENQSR